MKRVDWVDGTGVLTSLQHGMDDNGFKAIFKSVMQKVMDVYQPGAVVLQCGADSLAADRLAGGGRGACIPLSIHSHTASM